MTTVDDYLGRILDVAVFHGATEIGPARLNPGVFLPEEEVLTGTAKLAQRWLIEFLTESASMLLLQARGCGFMTAARLGRLRTEADVTSAFLLAQPSLAANLSGEDLSTDSTDEQYAGCSLDGVVIDHAKLTLTVSVFSVAGTSREVILPLPVTPGRPFA